MTRILHAGLAAATIGLALPAHALCALVCSCSTSTSGVAFGIYNPLSSANVDSSGNVQVTCGGVLGLLVPYTISLNQGAFATTFNQRNMAAGTHRLGYNLYVDSARTIVWGDGSAGTQTVSGSVTIALLGGTSQNYAAYGRIPGRQVSINPGVYSDTVVVTVTYQ